MAKAAAPLAAVQQSQANMEQLIRDAAKGAKFGNEGVWPMVGNTGVNYLAATAGTQTFAAHALNR